jgi:hypothetical protein
MVPLSRCEVKLNSQEGRRYRTVADAAAAIVQLAPTPATVGLVTASRRRTVIDVEFGPWVRS